MERKRWATRDEGARRFTTDLAPSRTRGNVFAAEQIGATRFRTPEGFLYCEDVPIARTGDMMYGGNETPVTAGPNGITTISRDAAHLFVPATLMSFQGKPLTNDHPSNALDVNPANWKDLAVGVVLNPRRGEGANSDVILADFMVTDAAVIAAIEAGKIEVSCGYDAMYVQTAPGRGFQTDIVGNHVALVERGRCGSRCAIGDTATTTEEEDDMKTRDNAALAATETPAARAVRKSFQDAADAAIAALPGVDQGTHVHIHTGGTQGAETTAVTTADAALAETIAKAVGAAIAPLAKTVDGLVKASQGKKARDSDDDEDDEAKAKTEDDDMDSDEKADAKNSKTDDSAALATSYQATLSGAEVLVPGLSMPAFDAKSPRKITVDTMCQARRRALDRFSVTADGATMLTTLNGGKTFDSLTVDCKGVAALFKSAVAAKGAINNGRVADGAAVAGKTTDGITHVAANGLPRPKSIAQVQAMNAKFWSDRGVKTV